MRSKRGMLMAKTVVKIIISLICVGLLVYLLVSLYYPRKDAQDLEKAEKTLTEMMDMLVAGEAAYDALKPPLSSYRGDWILVKWPFPEDSGRVIPLKCSGVGWDDCVCICKVELGSILRRNYDALAEKCNEKTFCLDIDSGFKISQNNGWYTSAGYNSFDNIIIFKDAPLKIKFAEGIISI